MKLVTQRTHWVAGGAAGTRRDQPGREENDHISETGVLSTEGLRRSTPKQPSNHVECLEREEKEKGSLYFCLKPASFVSPLGDVYAVGRIETVVSLVWTES